MISLGYFLKNRMGFRAILRLFAPGMYLNIGCSTLVSNISSVVSITLLGLMTITGYNIVSAAISMGVGALLSIAVFKEKPTVLQLVSLALVVLATALNLL